MNSQIAWTQIQAQAKYTGRWVALDHCRYNERSGQPVEGLVVDHDDDLVDLCSRLQADNTRYCAILYCQGKKDAQERPTHSGPHFGHAGR